MRVLAYRDGVAVDCIVVADVATISPDAIVLADGRTVLAPEGATWVAGATEASVGWHLDGNGTPIAPPIDLEAVRTAKFAELTSSCAASIVGGFGSDALGAPHTYPSKPADQINLIGSVIAAGTAEGQEAGWVTPFWCASGDGVWAYRDHTAAEIVAVGLAGKAHVVICQTRLTTLTAQVQAAADATAINSIAWEQPA